MNGKWNRAGTFLFAAAASCGLTLAVVWPTETQADDVKGAVDDGATLAPNEIKKGALIAASNLVQDERIKSRWYLELVVRNTTKEGPETAHFKPCVEMGEYEPMGRGAPPPSSVWNSEESVTVPPGETVVVRKAIPSGLSWRIYKAHLAGVKAEKTGKYPAVVRSFSSSFVTS